MTINPVDLLREANEEKSYTKHFVMMPDRWIGYVGGGLPTLAWGAERFEAGSAGRIPQDSGIYAFVVQSGVAPPVASWCMYIGKSAGLRVRFRQYVREAKSSTGRPRLVYMLNMWPDHTYFWFAPLLKDQLTQTEEALIRALTPPANREVTADIRAPHAAF